MPPNASLEGWGNLTSDTVAPRARDQSVVKISSRYPPEPGETVPDSIGSVSPLRVLRARGDNAPLVRHLQRGERAVETPRPTRRAGVRPELRDESDGCTSKPRTCRAAAERTAFTFYGADDRVERLFVEESLQRRERGR